MCQALERQTAGADGEKHQQPNDKRDTFRGRGVREDASAGSPKAEGFSRGPAIRP